MKKINSLKIFKTFFRIGAILLGGGYVIVPVMKEELIKKNNWITEDELYDYYCVSQCLSGIIAINMAILTGYKINKIKGSITALFAMSLSPVISILIIANLLAKIIQIPFIDGIFWGVNLSVIVLIYLTLKEIWQKSVCNLFTAFWFLMILILSIFKISPVILVVSSILVGIFIQIFKDLNKEEVK